MIHYVLGHSGAGKTYFCLSQFNQLEYGTYFFFPVDEKVECIDFETQLSEKNLIDCGSLYRDHLDERGVFKEKMVKKIKKAFNLGHSVFLDEFQLYSSDELINLILSSVEKDMYIIHQFPEQLESDHFSKLYSTAQKKYLLNPYSSPENYSV